MFSGIDFDEVKRKDCISNFTNKSVELFYKTVERYMKSNYLCEREEETFFVQVGQDIFEVGYAFWDEEFYYIKVCDPTKVKKSYKLGDILANRITEKERLIKEKIEVINQTVAELEGDGVPFKLIRSSIKMNKERY